jgi:uncharacterized membrane protein
MMKKYFKILLAVVLIFVFLEPINVLAQNADNSENSASAGETSETVRTSYEKAEVMSIEEKTQESEEGGVKQYQTIQEIKIKILSGKYKNEERVLENTVANDPFDLKFKEGDKIVVYIEELKDGTINVQIQDFWRLGILIWFIIFFLLVLLLVGGKQGLKSILSLIISIFLIFKVLIPQTLSGRDPMWLSLFVSILVAVITLLLVGGWKKKSIAAILGTAGGVIIAAILAIMVGKIINLTGLSTEESRTLFYKFPNLKFQGLLFGSIIIGALGAVMDVGMSIASSISEVKKAEPNIRLGKLIGSGLTVGRDIMGTMSNTLIFAYVGASLPLLLLFANLGESYFKFLNFDFVAGEVLRSVAGSIGLVAAIPLTALIAGWLENYRKK